MAVWDFVKSINLDLSGISNENIVKLVKAFDETELAGIKAELQAEIVKNEQQGEYLNIALRIAMMALEKGVDILL